MRIGNRNKSGQLTHWQLDTLYWLVLCKLNTSYTHLSVGNLSWDTVLIGVATGRPVGYWLDWWLTRAGSPRYIRKQTEQASHREQASKQYPSMAAASVPALASSVMNQVTRIDWQSKTIMLQLNDSCLLITADSSKPHWPETQIVNSKYYNKQYSWYSLRNSQTSFWSFKCRPPLTTPFSALSSKFPQ
jgi:hypothetical protein